MLSLCSDDAFGLAGHPCVRAAPVASARSLEERLADFHGAAAVRLHGTEQLARLAVADCRDVLVGSLAGALCSHGAYVAGEPEALELPAGRYVFSATPTPAAIGRALAALDVLGEEPWRVERLTTNAGVLRAALAREGFDVARSGPHVVPIVVDDALTAAASARAEGVLVERGSAELRLWVTAQHSQRELREAARVLARTASSRGLQRAA